MNDNSKNVRHLLRPLSARSRRRRLFAAGCVILWLLYLILSGSAFDSTLVLLALLALAVILFMLLRTFNIGVDHPLFRPLFTRPWRDGRDVLQLALRHLREVFIIAPGGSLLAPSAVELCMNPADYESLEGLIEIEVVNDYAAEAYEHEVVSNNARMQKGRRIEFAVVADEDVPVGRYRLRQRRHDEQHATAGAAPTERDLDNTSELDESEAVTYEETVQQSGVPVLRLVTGNVVAEARTSPAIAGRSRSADLRLPAERKISREHARFDWVRTEWRVTSLGLNGVTLNGSRIIGERPIRNGDVIHWGQHADAPMSRVEIV